jgi:hypothetical protein
MERPCVKLCTMSPSTCEWPCGSIIDHNLSKLCGESQGVITMLICNHCLEDGIWVVLHHHL